jgi:hypothetical protein
MQMMYIDEVVGFIIQQFLKERGNKESMSRHRLACTRCKALTSSTWRPGPCGTSSLCNACGLQYMQRGARPRMIDLVCDEGRVIWMTRDPETFQWYESAEADLSDHRISRWKRNEDERTTFVESKKRKFVDL